MTPSERLAAIANKVQDEACKHGDIALAAPVENLARVTGYYGSSIALQAMARILRETAREVGEQEATQAGQSGNRKAVTGANY